MNEEVPSSLKLAQLLVAGSKPCGALAVGDVTLLVVAVLVAVAAQLSSAANGSDLLKALPQSALKFACWPASEDLAAAAEEPNGSDPAANGSCTGLVTLWLAVAAPRF